MDRNELINDAKRARELGDPDLELSILKKLDSLQGQPVQEKDISALDYMKNMALGASARGNQAMAALNPWADQAKIDAEQEWVKQNKGAGLGSMLSDVAITAPIGGLGSLAARAFGAGLMEGATKPGGMNARMENALYGAVGSGAGEKMGEVASFALQPFKRSVDPLVAALAKKAGDLGIKLNAAQLTGNKALQYADSALDFIPSSSTAQHEFKDGQRKAWTKALMQQGHETADNAAPEAMGAMKDRISSIYEDVAGRNSVVVDDLLKRDLASVNDELMGRIPVNQKGIVKSYLKDFNTAPTGAEISGKQYQDIRSMLDKQAKAFKNSDPATHEALKSIRQAADDAMERSLNNPNRIGGNPSDLANWKQANKDWMVMKNVEGAVDPLTGQVSPAKLLNSMARKDANRVIYGKGDQELTDIAKVGKQFITPKTSDSGTAQRAFMIKMLTGGGIGGSLGTMALYNPALAAQATVATLLGGVALPKMAGAMMRKPNGYLVDGLVDLGKEVAPGLTRNKVISELLRNSGVQFSQDR